MHSNLFQYTYTPIHPEAYIGQLMCWRGPSVKLVFFSPPLLVPLWINGLEPAARPLRQLDILLLTGLLLIGVLCSLFRKCI